MRIYYDCETLTVSTTEYTKFLPVLDQTTDDFLAYDPEDLYANAGALYAKVLSHGGEVSSAIPSSPTEAQTVAKLNLLYHGTNWWLRIG